MEVLRLDVTNTDVAAELLGLQKAAYRIEADLIGSDAIPPLHETLADLVSSELRWRGVRRAESLVAALAYSDDGTAIDIDRLVQEGLPDFPRRA